MTPRRVMMVAYFFPPLGGVGVQRTTKFVRYLPDAGWTPVVIGPRGAAYRVMDDALLQSLDPALEVHRAPSIEPGVLRRAAGDVLRRVRGRSPSSRGAAPAHRAGQEATAGGPKVWLDTMWREWVHLAFIPDERIGWALAAAVTGLRAERRAPVDAIYSSSPPPSGHLAAGVIAAVTGRPWVADFRDPWVGNAFARRRPFLHERIERRLERWVVTHADRIVVATPGLERRYATRYPHRAARMVTIPNGYDSSDFVAIAARTEVQAAGADRPLRLVYAGSVYGDRELAMFLDGLTLALDRRPELRGRLRVEFIGWMSVPNQRLAEARRAALEPVLELTGFLPHGEALRRMRNADATLHLIAAGPDRDLIIGSKLFEYVGLDRPVLAAIPPGDARGLLHELDWGIVVDPTPRAVADGIDRLVDDPRPSRRADPDGRYERSQLARRLAAVLDEVATQG